MKRSGLRVAEAPRARAGGAAIAHPQGAGERADQGQREGGRDDVWAAILWWWLGRWVEWAGMRARGLGRGMGGSYSAGLQRPPAAEGLFGLGLRASYSSVQRANLARCDGTGK